MRDSILNCLVHMESCSSSWLLLLLISVCWWRNCLSIIYEKMEVEKQSSKGGFLQLFDWNAKSRKKLFSNKPDVPESSKHGKENVDSLTISRLQQMKLDDSVHYPSGDDWDSSMISDEGSGSKAPGVVARLMGLDFLPTLDASEPRFTPFNDSHSFRHSLHPRITTEFETDHHYVDYGMRNKLDGFSRNPVQDRLQKLQNRPIERFQSEALPPRSAKSVPITHHKMLSPIKSPAFILSRNATYIMETASKIIDQSPQSTFNGKLPSFRTSSIPLRIRDLKEKMEAEQRTSRIQETSQRPKACTPVSSSKSQPRDKRQCLSEVVVIKNKNKFVSPSTPVKTNIQKLEGPTSRNRSSMKQKEDCVKSVQLDKKQRITPKEVQNRSTTGKTHDVLTQNNQKQNGVAHKDRTNLKPRVPYQHYRKTTSTNGSSKEVKTSKKTIDNSAVGARRKELVSTTKKFSGKKRPTDGDIIFDGTTTNNVVIKEKERSVKCNITIDGSSNWESVDRKNGMDVVSFTFTSPIKKPVSESESTGQSGVKSRGLCLNFDQLNTGTSEFPSFGTHVTDSDALSVLLEQKLKELSSLVEASQCDIAKGGSSMHKDKSAITHDSDVSVDQILVKAKPEWQEAEVMECESNSENDESVIKHPCTSPSGEASLTDDSCITSNSTTTLTSNGNKQYLSAINMELLAEEIELQDSATSLPTTIFEFTSRAKWSLQQELEYIKEILNYAELSLEDLAFDLTQTVINDNLFDQLENQNKNMDPFLKPQRKALFDCVSVCLEGRRERALSGSFEEWSKWSTFFQKKALLAGEIQKEIRGWTSMEELMVDEVVEKDMSTGNGKWLDFEAEALEEGIVIETDILTLLIDEIVVDLSTC
ncbi:hypothetical protein L1987_54823 [Smallanthus sonchifolius]|uniref:Uncharacterized protein n=1 Tax=Smallanthus sonchifolius TaxID=185202 RepID=A0ACB9E8N3_9ASTR|nr:hypothetical protein L1987_54823 [Smallanthus sonchifolius]